MLLPGSHQWALPALDGADVYGLPGGGARNKSTSRVGALSPDLKKTHRAAQGEIPRRQWASNLLSSKAISPTSLLGQKGYHRLHKTFLN